MQKVFLLSTLMLSLAAGGAMAQNMTGDTQNPPAPNANVSVPDTVNSLPPGAMTYTGHRAGNDVGTTVVAPHLGAPVTIR